MISGIHYNFSLPKAMWPALAWLGGRAEAYFAPIRNFKRHSWLLLYLLGARDRRSTMSERNDAMLNGALMALGAVSVVDNVVAHWMLALHRAVPGLYALQVEWAWFFSQERSEANGSSTAHECHTTTA